MAALVAGMNALGDQNIHGNAQRRHSGSACTGIR
jgi:hypothetical protein